MTNQTKPLEPDDSILPPQRSNCCRAVSSSRPLRGYGWATARPRLRGSGNRDHRDDGLGFSEITSFVTADNPGSRTPPAPNRGMVRFEQALVLPRPSCHDCIPNDAFWPARFWSAHRTSRPATIPNVQHALRDRTKDLSLQYSSEQESNRSKFRLASDSRSGMAVGGAAARDVAAEDRHRLFLILAHVDKTANDFRAAIAAFARGGRGRSGGIAAETRDIVGGTAGSLRQPDRRAPPCSRGTNKERTETRGA